MQVLKEECLNLCRFKEHFDSEEKQLKQRFVVLFDKLIGKIGMVNSPQYKRQKELLRRAGEIDLKA